MGGARSDQTFSQRFGDRFGLRMDFELRVDVSEMKRNGVDGDAECCRRGFLMMAVDGELTPRCIRSAGDGTLSRPGPPTVGPRTSSTVTRPRCLATSEPSRLPWPAIAGCVRSCASSQIASDAQ